MQPLTININDDINGNVVENAFPLMVATKLVPTAESCDFTTIILMIAHDDEA